MALLYWKIRTTNLSYLVIIDKVRTAEDDEEVDKKKKNNSAILVKLNFTGVPICILIQKYLLWSSPKIDGCLL